MFENWAPTGVVFWVEGDSFLLSVRTVGIMLPLSEVKRTESGPVAEVA